ncbi:hypothetical protein JL720_14955 [Aureococcus anophagefferens]|nr:hypothetical protein JL720_14955 [Aureococcus anophagefferens]
MDEEYFLWQRGLRAAIHERLKVIELSFENVTRGLCAAVKRTTLALESSECGGSKREPQLTGAEAVGEGLTGAFG